MAPAEKEFTLIEAPVLATEDRLISIIFGVTDPAELYEVKLLTIIFVTALPTS